MNDNLKIEERIIKGAGSGFGVLLFNTLLIIAAILAFIFGIITVEDGNSTLGVVGIVAGAVYGFLVGPVLYCGLRVVKPNEALVLTLFGKYYGTILKEGFYFVNPFSTGVNPTKSSFESIDNVNVDSSGVSVNSKAGNAPKYRDNASGKCVSMKVMTLNNNKQKVNDKLGNPIEIGVVVIWKVVDPLQAVFNVDNYMEFLSIQADSALRNIVRLYPYDVSNDNDSTNDDELSLRGSSQEVAIKLKEELQSKTSIAGIEIIETRITHLAYAPEIAAAMLQRQQASAIIDARKLIVEGAVSMVEMALTQLSENDIVNLDEERRAQMVSNLLVVLCGNKDAQPIVNSGSIY